MTIGVVLLVLLVVASSDPVMTQFQVAKKKALDDFVASRDRLECQPCTDCFASFGIEAGMSVQEVEELLPEWTRRLTGGVSDNPPWSGTVSDYEFTYGPTMLDPVTGKRDVLLSETISVYFDHGGYAQMVTVHRSGLLWSDMCVFPDPIILPPTFE